MCSENEKPDRLIRMLYDIADGKPAGTRFKGHRQEG